jgi:uncharacterized lipoprotein YmbA
MRDSFALALLLAALALAGCASAPVTLIALPSAPPQAGPADDSPGPSILLRSVTVPGYLDAFPVVLGRAGGALVVSSNAEWAERLTDGVARVLRDALSRRLGGSRVLIARDARIPDADLTVEFLSLDPGGGMLTLDARWFFTCAVRAQSRGGRTRIDVPLAAGTPEAVAHATTAALTRFADELATGVPCASQSRRQEDAAGRAGRSPDDSRGQAH